MDFLNVNQCNKNLSFLQARDPSILSCNYTTKKENIRKNLALENLQETEIEEDDCTNIQINLRIKKAENIDEEDIYRIKDNEIHCNLPPSTSHSNNIKDVESIMKKFTFSHIFPPTSTQEEIFNLIVKPKVFKFINGDNCTLMSYGASGSGKTFTIVGTASEPGIIPRTLEYLFRTLPELPEAPVVKPTQSGDVELLSKEACQAEMRMRNELLHLARNTIDGRHTYTYQQMQKRLSTEPVAILDDLSNIHLTVWVSFSEIYNENIYDLLTPVQKVKVENRPKLKLASFNENTHIKNLTNISISSGMEAYQILQYGLHNLNYASTSVNTHSSRSHCIFTIKIAQIVKGTNIKKLNYYNFCDLAGSERLKKTLNVGDRLKESNNINTSLLVLGRCISRIRENQKRNTNKIVPYRESKLTRLFQRALSGMEGISMIVNMNPSKNMFEESLHVLNFSAIAKDVIIKQAPVKPKINNRFSAYLQSRSTAYSDVNQKNGEQEQEVAKLQDVIDKLYFELEQINRQRVEDEDRIREEVVQEQNAVIEDLRVHYRERMAAIENRHRNYMEEMREIYKNSTEESEVIILDSSSDEETTKCDDENNYQELQEENERLLLEIGSLKTELYHKSILINRKDEEITKLKAVIADAETTYHEMRRSYEDKLNHLLAEEYKLREANSELTILVENPTELLSTEQDYI